MKKLSTILLLLFLVPKIVFGAIALDNTTNSGQKLFTNSITHSHTTGSGDNRFMLVCVHAFDSSISNTLPSSVSYASIPMTKELDQTLTSDQRVTVWSLKNPSSGSNNLVVTFPSDFTFALAGVLTYTGVYQDNPIDVKSSTTGNSKSPTINLTTTAEYAWIQDCGLAPDVGTPSVGAFQTSRYNVDGTSLDYFSSSENTTATGTATMSWSIAASRQWIQTATALRPFNPASGTASSTIDMTQLEFSEVYYKGLNEINTHLTFFLSIITGLVLLFIVIYIFTSKHDNRNY